jgi:hypothetical protein
MKTSPLGSLSPELRGRVKSIKELDPCLLDEIEEFFESQNEMKAPSSSRSAGSVPSAPGP